MVDGVIIHAITDSVDEEFGTMNAHTHGMEEHGFKNLCCGVYMDNKDIAYVLNTVADLIVQGEINDANILCTHYLDDCNGKMKFKFYLSPAITFDEQVMQIVITDSRKKYKGVGNTADQMYASDIEPNLLLINNPEFVTLTNN